MGSLLRDSALLQLLALTSITALLLLFTGGCAASSDGVVVLTVDPNSVDQEGCGSSESPCASVLGALVFNNLTSSNYSNTLYGLQLQAGVYSGPNNRNISLPPSIAWINGNGSVVFVNSPFNVTTVVNSTYSYNTTMVTPIFNTSTSLTFTGLTFSGTFGYSDFNTYVISITDNGTNYPNRGYKSTFSFTNISFIDISYSYGGVACINAFLVEGSHLELLRVSTNALMLVSASAWISDDNICPSLAYTFPYLAIASLSISGVMPVNNYYYYTQSLISTSNVELSLSNTTITNSTMGLISSIQYPGAGCFNTSTPTTTVNNLSVQNSSIGGGVSAAIATISGVSVTNCQIGSSSVLNFYWGSASEVTISDNIFTPVSSRSVYLLEKWSNKRTSGTGLT